MKKCLLVITALLSCLLISAQVEIDKRFDFSGKKKVKLDIQIADSISVQTWDKPEVYIKAAININQNKDNDAYLTSYDESEDMLIVNARIRDGYYNDKDNRWSKTHIVWKVIIPSWSVLFTESINANITITGETGALDIKTISGFIDLSVPEPKKVSLDFSTFSGTIYTNHKIETGFSGNGIPARLKYEMNTGGDLIRLETISGDIYFRK